MFYCIAATTVGDLSWEAFCNMLEGQYQGRNLNMARASLCLFVQQTGKVQEHFQKWRETLFDAPLADLTVNEFLIAAVINGLCPILTAPVNPLRRNQ